MMACLMHFTSLVKRHKIRFILSWEVGKEEPNQFQMMQGFWEVTDQLQAFALFPSHWELIVN